MVNAFMRGRRAVGLGAVLCVLGLGCSEEPPADGQLATGGTSTSTGGAATTGGFGGTGGLAVTGGVPTMTGGLTLPSGGAVETGGVGDVTGGTPEATGGAADVTGGVVEASGGVGEPTGGMATGGVVETGGDNVSAGCGNTASPGSETFTIDVDGTTREYIVKVPSGYDPSKPYKLIYAWHYLGGTADRIANGFGGGFYGLESRSGGSAIFVAGQGLATSGGAGWPNTGGRDVAFAKALHAWMLTNYCIDEDRVFSTGMSYGGIMSNTVGCAMGDVMRAIAPIAGSGPRTFGGSSCTGQVAAWITHGNRDTVVSFSSGQGSRDHWRSANGCDTASTPVDPSPCVAYEGCDTGYPVHWCEWDGAHTTPSFAADAIWNFFDQF